MEISSTEDSWTLVAVVCMYVVLITPSELLQFYYYTASRPTTDLVFSGLVLNRRIYTIHIKTSLSLNVTLSAI